MKKAVVVLAVLLSSVLSAHADEHTSIAASPSSSTAGQTVTFTATFYFSCADGVANHYFLIDGNQVVTQSFHSVGQNATETLSISTLSVGTHAVAYQWYTSSSVGSCGGNASIQFTVRPKPAPPPPPAKASPSPAPTPTPSPPPPASPSPSPPESPTASSARLTVDVSPGGSEVPLGPLAVAVLAALVLVGGFTWLRFRFQRRK